MSSRVLVIGDNLAGLSTAFGLSAQGYDVTLLSQQAEPADVDEPLLLWGCDRATLSLLGVLGRSRSQVISSAMSIELMRTDSRVVRWPRLFLPAPLHTVVGLALFRGLPLRDRWRFLIWLERTWEKDPALPLDLDFHTAEAWLRGIGQSELARHQFWTPLSRLLLGDDVRTVSAASLLSSLIRCFIKTRRDARPLQPCGTVRACLLTPLRAALDRAGVPIDSSPVDHLRFDMHRATGVHLRDGRMLTADWYIGALPHGLLTPLLPERAMTHFSYFQQLTQLRDAPSLTVAVSIGRVLDRARLLLLADATCHWMVILPRRDTGTTEITCRINGPREPFDDPDLISAVKADVIRTLGLRGAESAVLAVTPRVSTSLALTPGTTSKRPLQQSPFANFFLVGEWTDTGLPANVESAVLSAELCIKAVAAKAKASATASG